MTALATRSGTARDGILDRLRTAIGQALDLAGQIERGQAVMPLRDYFEALAESIDTAPFVLNLLGLDTASRARALGWLCGEEYHVKSVEVSGAVGLVEVQMAERGYVLVKSGRRQEFDRLEPFLEAVRAADLVRQGDANAWMEPMHLELAAPPGLQGLKLLMPESVTAVVENHALLARLRSESNVLAVAGPVDQEPDEAAAGVIRALAADALATWAITCGASPPDSSGPVWPGALDGIRLPSAHLEPGGAAHGLPEFLFDRESGLRRVLFACQRARRLERALDLFEERLQQDLRQHEARRKMLLRRSTALGDLGQDRTIREAAEISRRQLDERLATLEAQLARAQRERLLPISVPNNKINNLLEDVTVDDIARETVGRIVQLNVAPAFREKVRRLVSDIVRAEVHDDLERLNSELAALADETASRLSASVGGDFAVPEAAIDEAAVWKTVDQAIHLESRYHAELAQKGSREKIFEFVMHCRTPVFLMTIVVSPIYSFLPGLREPLMKMSLFLLVGGAYWAYRGMRDEEHKVMEREVLRLRDTLGAEVRALYQQALRDWCERAAHHLRDIGKKLGHRVDEHLKVRSAALTGSFTQERIELQDKLKAVEIRLRELGGLIQQFGRVRQASAEARQVLERAARDAVHDAREPVRMV